MDGGHLRREFVVGLPRVLVRVTGTRFTLVADPAGDRVRVDQGEVRCDAGGLRGLPIIAGREGVFAAGAPPRIADLDAGANTRPLPIADAAWQLLELRGTGSHRTPGYRATLDFVLDGAAEAEAWAALVAEPGTADWSRAAGVELT